MPSGFFCFMAAIFTILGLFTIVENPVRRRGTSVVILSVGQIFCMYYGVKNF